MRKRYTKIICAGIAAISAFGMVFSSACGSYKRQAVEEKDTFADKVYSNGGFLVQTGGDSKDGFVYFINGKESNTADNTFGSVVKGSIQRIKKSDLQARNYSSTQTIVPSVVYSGQYNAGIYIYGDYIYYTTPSTQKDGSGNVLNSSLDFKRTKLDGSETDKNYIWQSSDNAVDYRYVQGKDGKVYILYAISENLYGTSATNIHSVNCETGENKMLAYNVSSYVFDTKNPENPIAYYTMNVPYFVGGTQNYGYNQVYRVRADVHTIHRTYDFSSIEDYDAEKDPVYVNYGDYVFDGIGTTQNQTEGRVTQFNYNWDFEKGAPDNTKYELTNSEYTYTLNSYEDGDLYFTRKSATGSTTGNKYLLKDREVDSDNDFEVDVTWDAIGKNNDIEPFIYLTDSNTYTFWKKDGKTYAINSGSSGITKGELVNGVVENAYTVSEDTGATILEIREEATSATETHTYLYYSLSGGNGYTFHRIAIDGSERDYNDLPAEPTWDKTWTYRGVKILDLDACSSWYEPEFVGNTVVFASETNGMSSYNYIMACSLEQNGYMMTNKAINDYNKKFEAVTEKIEEYSDEKNADGTYAYENLSNALKYLFYTGDEGYLDTLIQAYVDIEGRDKEYLYSERTAQIYHEFANVTGDWKDYKEDVKEVNGKETCANSRDYYYGLLGKMNEADAEGLKDTYKSQFMQAYPVDNSTWWEKLSTGAKVGFIIGMVAAGLVVLGGIAVLTVFIVKRIKKKKEGASSDSKMKVDITDDKNVNVYDEENN